MPTLSDTQLIILSAACARDNRHLLPLPKSLRGGAARKVIDALIARGLVAEVDASSSKGAPIWREHGDGRKLTLVATPAAEAVLDGGASEAAPAAPQRADKAQKAGSAAKAPPKARKAPEASPAPAVPKTRPGTKQARLIALLSRPKGASIAEIAQDLGWQPHTVRGALAGALRKKLGLAIASEPHDTRGRVYRIVA